MKTALRLRAIGVAAVCATLAMFACGKSGSSSGGAAKSSAGARVTGSVIGLTFAPSVVTLERRDGLGALKEISTNGDLLLFSGSNSTIAALKPGSVLLIKGLLAKKVLAVEGPPVSRRTSISPRTLRRTRSCWLRAPARRKRSCGRSTSTPRSRPE